MGNIAEETRWLDATAQAALVRNKEVTASELAEAAITRIEQLNPSINAVNIPWFAHGRELAKHIDATSPNTAFAGVPFLLKDLHTMYEGQHISQGNKALKEANYIATSDTTLVSRFKQQHLVFLGRTSSPEFGSLPVTEPEAWGATRNPWNTNFTPGGSSGGAGSAVASGMCAIAQGNDVAGSVRWPAFCNGIIGLRPTMGRMPTGGTNPNPRGLSGMMMSTQGPLARTMADLRLTYSAMQYPNWNDPFWVPMQNDFPASKSPIRVALITEDGHPMDDATKTAVRTAGRLLEDAGYEVDEISPPMLETLFSMWLRLGAMDVLLGLVPSLPGINDSGLTKATEGMLPMFPEPTPQVLMKALADRDMMFRAWNQFFETYPLIVMPVLTKPFMRPNEDIEGSEIMAPLWDHLRYTVNLASIAIPSLAFPIGNHDGAPQGVQIVSHSWREDLLLNAGDALELRLGKVHVVDPVW